MDGVTGHHPTPPTSSFLDLTPPPEFVSKLEADLTPNRVATPPRLVSVVDVGGLGLSQLNAETFLFLTTASEVMNLYYPERVVKILIVNAPWWFAGSW